VKEAAAHAPTALGAHERARALGLPVALRSTRAHKHTAALSMQWLSSNRPRHKMTVDFPTPLEPGTRAKDR